MSGRLLAGIAGGALLGTLWLATPIDREVVRTHAPHDSEEVERVGGERTIGQSFVSPSDRLDEIRVVLAAPPSPDAFPIFFHLRHGRWAPKDIRTVELDLDAVGPDGTLRVRFLPVEKSGGRPYAFFLRAPNAEQPIALYREIDGSIYGEGATIRGTDERPGDLEFAASARRPRVRWLLKALRTRGPLHPFVLPEVRTAASVGAAVMAIVVLGAKAFGSAGRRTLAWCTPTRVVWSLVVLSILAHLALVFRYPGVNDEGAYLMDIQNIQSGFWPFRDTLTKGPLFLVLLAPVALLFPHSVVAARGLIVAAAALETFLLFRVGERLGGRRVGTLTALLWALSPLAVSQTTQLFLQPVSMVFVTAALLALFRPPPAPARGWRTVVRSHGVLAGLFLAAAYLTRASSLAFLPLAVLLPFARAGARRAAVRESAHIILSALVILALVAVVSVAIIGPQRTAVLLNVEAYTIGRARGGSEIQGLTLPSAPNILSELEGRSAALVRTGLPLVLLWMVGAADHLRRVARLPGPVGIALALGVAGPLLQRLIARHYHLADGLVALAPAITAVSVALLAVSAVVLARRGPPTPEERRRAVVPLLFSVVTWTALAILYAFFGRFRQQYHAEFLLAYLPTAAWFLGDALPKDASAAPGGWARIRARAPAALLAGLTAAGLVLGVRPALALPHTGSIDLRVAAEVAAVIRAHTAPGDEVLTAQGLFTALAGRVQPFGAAHPGWYLEERVGNVPAELRRLFLPDKEVLRSHLATRPVKLIVIDRRTREIYITYDPAMQERLQRDYRLLTSIEHPSDGRPTEIWLRKE